MKKYLLLILILCLPIYIIVNSNTVTTLKSPDGKTELAISTTYAKTAKSRTKGLMHVKDLPEYSGMLFIWDEYKKHKIWMKNTLIPLDIIFAKDNNIIFIKENAQPHDLTVIDPPVPVNYVLEVNAGVVKNHDINKNWTLHTNH